MVVLFCGAGFSVFFFQHTHTPGGRVFVASQAQWKGRSDFMSFGLGVAAAAAAVASRSAVKQVGGENSIPTARHFVESKSGTVYVLSVFLV